MSLIAKAVQLAPVILATGATIGLLVIKIEDEKTKKIIRVIALILGIGTAFSVATQIPVVLAAMEDVVKVTARILGIDDESRLARVKKDAEIAAARARAEAEAQAAKTAAEQAIQAARVKAETDRLADERRVAEEKRARDAALEKAKADSEIARIEGERRTREAEAARRRATIDAETEQQNRANSAQQDARKRQAEAARWQYLEAARCAAPGHGDYVCCPHGQVPAIRPDPSPVKRYASGMISYCRPAD